MAENHVPKNILYRFAFSKVIVIVLSALLFAGLSVSVANDLFAFVKPSRDISIEITEPVSVRDISSMLQELGVIENSLAFRLYVELKSKEAFLEDFCGTVELNSNMSYRDILNKFIYF